MVAPSVESLRPLFDPLSLRSLTLKNRIVMPPMVMNYATADGLVTERSRAYYAARAKGGVALVIVEASYVRAEGKGFANSIGLHHDGVIPGLRGLAAAIHAGGVLAAIQIWHAGRRASPPITGLENVAPSAIAGANGFVPRELQSAEIDGLVDAFGQAARRAREAGFDAIELHMGHGYLLNQFLSPFSNQRDDAYGGSLEGRLRFPLAVVAAVRREIAPDCPIIARLSADEFVPGGLTLADTRPIARRLAEGGVDVISVSGGIAESPHMASTGLKKGSAKTPPGFFLPLAAAIKEAVTVPVIAVGRLHDPLLAAEVLAAHRADLIAVGRALLVDPEWANKVAAGRIADIGRCTCCNGCQYRIRLEQDVVCKQNKLLGREYLR